jgi:hypothetical protein
MRHKIQEHIESLWLQSKPTDVIIMDTKTLDAIYIGGEQPIFVDIATSFGVKEVFISDNVDGFKVMCYAEDL